MTLGGGYMLPSRDGHKIAGDRARHHPQGGRRGDTRRVLAVRVHGPAETDGPPPHLHTREDESFICLAGRLDVHLGGRDFVLEHGDYLYLPRDVIHAFRNPYPEESRVISVVSPAGLEGYYQALAEMPPGPKDIGLMKKIMADFGIELQLPPEVA
ncbi:cupin domain-containing protein [Streptomyces sp. L7]